MKKRILSLTLALLMLLTLAFVGCNKEEEKAPTPPATEKLLDNVVLAPNKEQTPTFSKLSFKAEDFVGYCDNGLIATAVTTKDADGVTPLSTTVSFTSIYTGTKVDIATINHTVLPDAPTYKDTVTEVSDPESIGDFIYVVTVYGDDDKFDIAYYNKNAEKVAEKLGITNALALEERIMFDKDFLDNFGYYGLISLYGNIYLIDEDTQKLELVLENGIYSSIDFDELWYIEELGYFVYSDSEDETIFLDKKLNFVKQIKFNSNANAYTSWMVYFEKDVLYTQIIVLPEDATEYDIIYLGYKANVQYTMYNFDANTYTEFAGYGNIIPTESYELPKQEYKQGYYGKDLGGTMVSYYEIQDNKTLVAKNDFAVVKEDGTIVKFITAINDQHTNFYVTQNGMAYYYTSYGNYYFDPTTGTTLGVVKSYSDYNNLWCIVDDKEVYDASNTLIYTIPDNYEVDAVLSNSLLLSTEVEDATTHEVTKHTYLWKGVDQMTLICSTPENPGAAQTISGVYGAIYGGYAIMTMNIATMTGSVVFYNDLGVEVAKYDNVVNIKDSFSSFDTDSYAFEVSVTAGDGTITKSIEVITFVNPAPIDYAY